MYRGNLRKREETHSCTWLIWQKGTCIKGTNIANQPYSLSSLVGSEGTPDRVNILSVMLSMTKGPSSSLGVYANFDIRSLYAMAFPTLMYHLSW